MAKGKRVDNEALEADGRDRQVAQLVCHVGGDLHSSWRAVKCHPVPHNPPTCSTHAALLFDKGVPFIVYF